MASISRSGIPADFRLVEFLREKLKLSRKQEFTSFVVFTGVENLKMQYQHFSTVSFFNRPFSPLLFFVINFWLLMRSRTWWRQIRRGPSPEAEKNFFILKREQTNATPRPVALIGWHPTYLKEHSANQGEAPESRLTAATNSFVSFTCVFCQVKPPCFVGPDHACCCDTLS